MLPTVSAQLFLDSLATSILSLVWYSSPEEAVLERVQPIDAPGVLSVSDVLSTGTLLCFCSFGSVGLAKEKSLDLKVGNYNTLTVRLVV